MMIDRGENSVSLSSERGSVPETSQSTPSIKTKLKAARPKVLVRQRKSKRLQSILNPKTVARTRYFTAATGVNDNNAIDMAKEPSPLVYPEDFEEFAHKVMTKAWRNDIRIKELKLKCHQRPSYKDRQRKGLLNRLYVKEPTLGTMKTVLDVDPDYFKIIEGRPVLDKLDIRDYIQTVRDSLRTKIITGYREDDIMLIEENLRLEQKVIDIINENYQMYVDAFEDFLYKDHTTAMKMLKDAEQAATDAFNKYEEYKLISKMYGTLRSSIFNLEEKWRNCKTYQKFLYVVSPHTWRMAQKTFRRASVFMMQDDPDDDENIFGRYRVSLMEKGVSLTDILNLFREELKEEEGPPKLYFTEPVQLMEVFRFMEMQNLNSLLHSEELALPLEQVKEGMRDAMESFDVEIRTLQETIDTLEGGISWQEERARYLEEFALDLIDTEFKALIMDDSVLNLHVFVEDVYETRIAPNDANLSILKMMKAIEEKYRSELLALDKVPSEQVALLEGSLYSEQMMVMKLAEKAARQYTELERLTHSLNKAYAPPPDRRQVRGTKNRSPPPKVPKPIVLPPRSLTEPEKDYLNYFTDFCQYTDNPSQYGINIHGEEEQSTDSKSKIEVEEEEEIILDNELLGEDD